MKLFELFDNRRAVTQGSLQEVDRRGFLKGMGAAAAAGTAMSVAGPEIATLVKGFAEQVGGLNGIQALKAMLKVATAEELYNMYDYEADSGILADAITDSDLIALDRAGHDSWDEFEEECDENGVDAAEEFKRLTGKPLKIELVNDILKKVDPRFGLEDFFSEYPDALEIINPFENESESIPTMQKLANINTAAKGANLPAPIVGLANAVSDLVRQIFKSHGQPVPAPQQPTAQPAPRTIALPAPSDDNVLRPELNKQKEKVPVKKNGSQDVAEGSGQNLSVQQLATISDEALDKAYGYGRSTPGNTFGWQANLMSAAYAKKMIDAGVTDIEAISDAIHKGWNVTAQKFVQNPDQFDDTEKLRQAGKLDAKLQQRAKLMKINYAQLDNDEQEKDRVVARALLQALKGQQGVLEGKNPEREAYEQGGSDAWYHRGFDPEHHGYQPGTPEYREYKRGYDLNDAGPGGGKQY